MLGMLLIMTLGGGALIVAIIAIFEWRAAAERRRHTQS
jgi:hypothetical protein